MLDNIDIITLLNQIVSDLLTPYTGVSVSQNRDNFKFVLSHLDYFPIGGFCSRICSIYNTSRHNGGVFLIGSLSFIIEELLDKFPVDMMDDILDTASLLHCNVLEIVNSEDEGISL